MEKMYLFKHPRFLSDQLEISSKKFQSFFPSVKQLKIEFIKGPPSKLEMWKLEVEKCNPDISSDKFRTNEIYFKYLGFHFHYFFQL